MMAALRGRRCIIDARRDDVIRLLLQNRRRIDLRHHHAIDDARYRIVVVVDAVTVLVR
jgi:hypothetical protein